MGVVQLTTHEISYSQRKIKSIVHFLIKNMKFCIVVVHNLTYDISYDAKLYKSKMCYFWGKLFQYSHEKHAKYFLSSHSGFLVEIVLLTRAAVHWLTWFSSIGTSK